MTYPGRSLYEILATTPSRRRMRRRPRFSARQLTFREIRHAPIVGRALRPLGIGKGDRVGIMLPNCPQVHRRGVRDAAARRRRGQHQPDLHGARAVDGRGRLRVQGADHARSPRADGARPARAGDLEHVIVTSLAEYSGRASADAARRWHDRARRSDDDDEGEDLPRVVIARKISRCCNTPAARPARRKGAMLTHGNIFANVVQTRPGNIAPTVAARDATFSSSLLPHLCVHRRHDVRHLGWWAADSDRSTTSSRC